MQGYLFDLGKAGYSLQTVLQAEWWEILLMCDAIDRDRARRNLDFTIASGLAFGGYEEGDRKRILSEWEKIVND